MQACCFFNSSIFCGYTIDKANLMLCSTVWSFDISPIFMWFRVEEAVSQIWDVENGSYLMALLVIPDVHLLNLAKMLRKVRSAISFWLIFCLLYQIVKFQF